MTSLRRVAPFLGVALVFMGACRIWQPGQEAEARTITLDIEQQGRDFLLSGQIESSTAHCIRGEEVLLERRLSVSGSPKPLAVSLSKPDGTYVARIAAQNGWFRAIVEETKTCRSVSSPFIRLD